jgi:hypothetical protein
MQARGAVGSPTPIFLSSPPVSVSSVSSVSSVVNPDSGGLEVPAWTNRAQRSASAMTWDGTGRRSHTTPSQDSTTSP